MGNYFEGSFFVKLKTLPDTLRNTLEEILSGTFCRFDDTCDFTRVIVDYGVILLDNNDSGNEIPIDYTAYVEMIEDLTQYQELLNGFTVSKYYVSARVNCKNYKEELSIFLDYLKDYIDKDSNPLIVGEIRDEDCTYFKEFTVNTEEYEKLHESRNHICKGCEYNHCAYLCEDYGKCERAYNLGKKASEDVYFLKKAIRIATKAHEGQVDKSGVDYINHPLKVMDSVSSIEAKIIAVLHDTIEDTTVTLEFLRNEGFSDKVLEALVLLTHKRSTPYLEYIEEIKKNELATEVKIADLIHNLDVSRLKIITEKDNERLIKYRKALEILKT